VARDPSTESIISNQAGISLFIAQSKTNIEKKTCSPLVDNPETKPARNLASKEADKDPRKEQLEAHRTKLQTFLLHLHLPLPLQL
jgi:hypothetical protein